MVSQHLLPVRRLTCRRRRLPSWLCRSILWWDIGLLLHSLLLTWTVVGLGHWRARLLLVRHAGIYVGHVHNLPLLRLRRLLRRSLQMTRLLQWDPLGWRGRSLRSRRRRPLILLRLALFHPSALNTFRFHANVHSQLLETSLQCRNIIVGLKRRS